MRSTVPPSGPELGQSTQAERPVFPCSRQAKLPRSKPTQAAPWTRSLPENGSIWQLPRECNGVNLPRTVSFLQCGLRATVAAGCGVPQDEEAWEGPMGRKTKVDSTIVGYIPVCKHP